MDKIKVQVSSEIGELEAVIVHTPGQEVASMTPKNAERALYSDILNLSVAQKEYCQFKGVLEKHAQVFEMRDLLSDILKDDSIKESFITDVFKDEAIDDNIEYFLSLNNTEITKQLIEGLIMKKDNLTRFFDKDRYSLRPLHNFFFMRDASMSINSSVLIGKMASRVRDRETKIMEAIFNNHPLLETTTYNPSKLSNNTCNISIEGGDVLVAREDVLVIGTGLRTSSQGIDFILEPNDGENKIEPLGVSNLNLILCSKQALPVILAPVKNPELSISQFAPYISSEL